MLVDVMVRDNQHRISMQSILCVMELKKELLTVHPVVPLVLILMMLDSIVMQHVSNGYH